jgi:phage terminase small subunit
MERRADADERQLRLGGPLIAHFGQFVSGIVWSMAATQQKSIRRAKFIAGVLAGKSYARAYLDAGFQCKPEHAPMAGYRLARKPAVAKEIREAREQAMSEMSITAERVLSELAAIAFCDVRKLFHEDGQLKDLSELDAESVAAIAKFEVTESRDQSGNRITRVHFHDKLKALQLLAKYVSSIGASRTPGEWKSGSPHKPEPSAPTLTQRIEAEFASIQQTEDAIAEVSH